MDVKTLFKLFLIELSTYNLLVELDKYIELDMDLV